MNNYLLNLSLLRNNRDYRLLYLGQFVSLMGAMMTGVALPYQMYVLTHSTPMVGLLSFIQLLSLLITSLPGGLFADRYNRRFLLLISELLLSVCCVLLGLNAFYAHPSVSLVFVVSALMSAINGFHRPALDSISQQLVFPKDYNSLGALRSFKISICMVAGPSVAGLVIAKYGIVITYFMDFATFLISFLSLFMMHNLPKPIKEERVPILVSLKQGMRFAFRRQELMGSYWIDFIAMIFAVPNVLFPAMAQMLGGVKVLGLLYASPPLGALLMSFFSGWTTRVNRDGKAIAIAAALWGITMMGLGLSSSLWWVLFCLVLAGGFETISNIFRTILWNNTIPQVYRGRLASIEMLNHLSAPKFGDTRADFMAAGFGVRAAVVSGGLFCTLGVVLCCFCMPKFWRHRSDQQGVTACRVSNSEP